MGFFERLKQNMKRRHERMIKERKWSMDKIKEKKNKARKEAINELKTKGVTEDFKKYLIEYCENDWSDFGRFSAAFQNLWQKHEKGGWESFKLILEEFIKDNSSNSSFGRALQNEYNKKYPKTDKKTTNSGNLKMGSKPKKKNEKQSTGSGNMEINRQLLSKTIAQFIKDNSSNSSFGRALQNEYNKKYPKTDKKTTNSGNLKMGSKPKKENEKQSTGSGNMEINKQLLSKTIAWLENARKLAVSSAQQALNDQQLPPECQDANMTNLATYLIMTITEEQGQAQGVEIKLEEKAMNVQNILKDWWVMCATNKQQWWTSSCPSTGFVWWVQYPPKENKNLYHDFLSPENKDWEYLTAQLDSTLNLN